MPITPDVTEGWRRVYRTFWAAFVPLAVVLVTVAVLLAFVFALLAYSAQSASSDAGFWPALDPHRSDLPLGGFVVGAMIVNTALLCLLLPLALAVLAGALAHLLLIVRPTPPLPVDEAGETVLIVRARLRPPGSWIGAAGQLHLTRKFLLFVPHRWRLLASSGPPVEELLIPLEEIASVHRGRTTGGQLIGLRIVRRSGDEEHLTVWRSGRFRKWLGQVQAGRTPAAALPGSGRWMRGSIVGGMATMIAAFAGWHAVLRLEAATAYAWNRAEGHPITLAELNASYAVPRGENAADKYFDAAVNFVPASPALGPALPILSSDESVALPPLGAALEPTMRQAMEEFVAPNRKTLALLREARQIPECRFPIDFTTGAAAFLPNLAPYRLLQAPVRFNARLAAERGDAQEAADSILDMLALGECISRTPAMISCLTGAQTINIAVDMIEECLARTAWSDAQLAAVSQRLRASIDPEPMSRALMGEQSLYLDALDNDGLFGPAPRMTALGFPPTLNLLFNPWILTGLRGLDRIEVLRVTSIALDQNTRPRVLRILDSKVPPRYMILGRMHATLVGGCVMTGRLARARVLNAMVALAAKRHQLAHGSLPESLEKMVPEFLEAVPRDLFDGEPLRYRRTEHGALIYSVGKDLKDNSGKRIWQTRRYDPDAVDIVFEIFEKP